MGFFERNIAAALIGFALDLLIGDPEGWPHPVIWIGRYIAYMEERLRARGGNLRRAAVALTASAVLLSMLATGIVLFLLSLLGEGALLAGMGVLAWWCLSAKCLAKEGRGVADALQKSLEDGRRQVRRIVGRDTSALDAEEILKAAVETVAENTTDGVIAPMLYLALGGPVLAMGFKAASTLDSMVGYLDERYRDIGWASAKLDDAFNYLPARLCGVLMGLSAGLCGMDMKNAFRILRRDHANHLSPNCAWSEAAAAGALGVQLGGTHLYFGKPVQKPTIGDALRAIETRDIRRACQLMYCAACLLACLLAAVGAML